MTPFLRTLSLTFVAGAMLALATPSYAQDRATGTPPPKVAASE
jgi:hypothetical protein